MAGPWEQFQSTDQGPWTQFAPVTPPPPDKQSALRQVADVPLGVAKGAVQGVRMIADAFGAGSDTSNTIKSAETYLADLMSAQAKNDQQEISRIMKDAEDKGVLDQVKAGIKAFTVAPIDTLSSALGTAAPVIAATLGSQILGAGALVGTGVGVLMGAGMGAGTIKGTIYEETKQALIQAGASPQDAENRAQLAQEYGGKNLDQILLGTVIGGAAAAGPLEKGAAGILARRILGKTAATQATEAAGKEVTKGAIRQRLEAGALEAIPEATQAAQEKVAENIAQQREGLDVPTFRGAAGAATLEGIAGAGLGTAIGGYRGEAVPAPKPAPVVAPVAPVAPVSPEVAIKQRVEEATGVKREEAPSAEQAADLFANMYRMDDAEGRAYAERMTQERLLRQQQAIDAEAERVAELNRKQGMPSPDRPKLEIEERPSIAEAPPELTSQQELLAKQAEIDRRRLEAGLPTGESSTTPGIQPAAPTVEAPKPVPKIVDNRPLEERAAKNRLLVMRNMLKNQGGDPESLAIVPHPSVEGKFAIQSLDVPTKLTPGLPQTAITRPETPTIVDPVNAYIEVQRRTNTPAARMFVQDFEAGKISREDVQRAIEQEQKAGRPQPLTYTATGEPGIVAAEVSKPRGEREVTQLGEAPPKVTVEEPPVEEPPGEEPPTPKATLPQTLEEFEQRMPIVFDKAEVRAANNEGNFSKLTKALQLSSNPAIRRIGQLAAGISSKITLRKPGNLGKNIAGVYRYADDSIQMVRGHAGNEHTNAHETLHALISKAQRYPTERQKPVVAQIEKLYEHVKKELNRKGIDAYGLTNPREFTAEAMTNPQFQFELMQIPYPGKKSAWTQFVKLVADLLGIQNTNALTEVMNLVDRLAMQKQPRKMITDKGLTDESVERPPELDVSGLTKVIKGRDPQLQAAAQQLKEGKITSEEYEKYVNYYTPIEAVEPEKLRLPSTEEAMRNAVASNKANLVNQPIADGAKVGLRLDIPSTRAGVPTVSVHEGASGKASQGKSKSYTSTAHITNATFETRSQKAGLEIAVGAGKEPLQTVEGTWVNDDPQAVYEKVKQLLKDPAWQQVGFDPTRHGYFYDRKTGEPVASASEVYQIGTLLIAKDVKYAPKSKFMYSLRSKQGLYSELENKIAQGSNKAPAASWKAYINGLTQKGVKPEEIEWSGVRDWLDLQKGTVTKDDLLNYLKQGGVQVEETVLGRLRKPENEELWALVRRNDVRRDLSDAEMQRMEDLKAKLEAPPAKYGQYTLPGGENYREVLLTLPTQAQPVSGRVVKDGKNEQYPWAIFVNGEEVNRVSDESVARDVLEEELTRARKKARRGDEQTYRSSHWDQPNVLAHIRVNDRTDADGKKVLFVEEIQSDWGQEGKKNGFKSKVRLSDAEYEELVMLRYKVQDGGELTPEERQREQELSTKATSNTGLPAAPFVTKTEGWLNLALKRVMVMAAEGGYDKVAFVNGEQSAERYDLSKQVERIEYDFLPADTVGVVRAFGFNGEEVISRAAKPEDLPDIVGKEVANKLMAEPAVAGTRTLTGESLKVGGEGMKTFYDQIVPMAVKKLLPKVGGGQMGMVEFGKEDWIVRDRNDDVIAEGFSSEENARQYAADYSGATVKNEGGPGEQTGFSVTPEMKQKVETTGLPLFSKKGVSETQLKDFEQTLRTLLNKFGLKDVGLSIIEGMQDSGSYAQQLIRIAASADNPVRTLRHEAIHALRELGFFTEAQWKSLSKMAKDKWIDQYLKQRNVDGKPLKADEESRYDAYMREYEGNMEKITEEAVADAFADFEATKPPAGMLASLLKRLKDLFQSIKSALTKVESPEQIFGKVEKGELKAGAKAEAGESKSLGGVKAAAQKAMQKQPMPEKGLSHVSQDLTKLAQPIFFPQNKTVIDRIEGMKDRFWQRLAQKTADQFRTIKEYSPLGYMQARLSKSIDGSLEGLMFHGQVFDDGGALNIKKNTKGMIDILKPIGKEVDSYLMWVALNRESRLPENKRSKIENMEQLVSRRDEFAAGTLNGRPRVEVYQDVLKQLNQLNKSVLDIALAKGLINQEGYDKFSNDIYYIPFYRKMEEDGDISGAQTASGLTSQYFSKELKGGDKPFGDLMENMLRNWSHILSASMKNQASQTTVNDAMKLNAAEPNLKVGLEWKDGKVYSVSSGKPIEAKIDEDTGKVLYEEGQLRPDLTTAGAGMAKIMVDGSPMYFKITDDLLMDSISSIGYLGPKSKFLDVAKGFKNMLQYGVTLSPIFKTNNLIRDSVSAMAVSDLEKTPFANIIKGISLSKSDSPTYISGLAGGAIFNFGSAYEGDQAKLIKRLLDKNVGEDTILDTKEKIANAIKKTFDAYQHLGDKSEAANRLALYQQMRDKGMSHLEASFLARDLLDFSMQGSWPAFRLLTQVVPFMNARIQGLYKLGRDGINPTVRVLYNATTGKENTASDKVRAAQFATVSSAVMLASALLYLSFKDDEDFKKRDAWDRDNFWWFKIPTLDIAFRIPKPFEVGALGTLVERSLEQMVDQGAEGKQFADSMKRTLWDTFALNPTPQFVKPILDLYANKDSFSGAPIESAGMERLSKQERITDQTSPIAIALGGVSTLFPEKMELSPVQVDYAMKGYFGWLGAMASVTSTYAVMPFKDGEYPDARWLDRASLGLVRELPAAQSAYVTSFYENAKEISQAYADMRHYKELGDSEKVQDIFEKNGDKIMLAKFYDKTSKHIANVRKQIQLVINDKTLDGATKKQEIDRMKFIMSEMAKQAEEVRKSIKT